jgi:hypothetical protein
MANKSVIYQKDLKKSRKKCFCFVNSSFVYETCGKLRCVHDEDPQKGKKKIKLKDTNLSLQAHSPVLVSRKK